MIFYKAIKNSLYRNLLDQVNLFELNLKLPKIQVEVQPKVNIIVQLNPGGSELHHIYHGTCCLPQSIL